MRELLKPNAERYEAFAKAYASKGGHATISECPVCGFLEWQSTKLDAPTGYTVKPRDGWDAPCACCESVRRRAPEVYDWVVNVAAMVLRQSSPSDSRSGGHSDG